MRKLKIALLTCGLSMLLYLPAYADWVQQESGKEWENDNLRYEQDGQYLTNQWMEVEGGWYYLGADGFLLNNITQNIDGVDYTFDGSGRWTDHSTLEIYDNQVIYTQLDFNYSIQFTRSNHIIPSGFFLDNINNSEWLSICDENSGYSVDIWHYPRSEFPDFPSGDVISDLCLYIHPKNHVFVDKDDTPVQTDDFRFEHMYILNRSHYEYLDVYTCIEENGSFMVVINHHWEIDEEKSLEILNKIKRIG